MDARKEALKRILALAQDATGERLKGLKKPAIEVEVEDSEGSAEGGEDESEMCPECGKPMEGGECLECGKAGDESKLKALAAKLGK